MTLGKIEYNSTYFGLTYTFEENPPHPTIPYSFYEDKYAITVLLRGEGDCTVEGNVYSLKCGDLVALSPDEIRCFHFADKGCHERLSVYFSKNLLLPFFEYDLPLMSVFTNRTPGLGNKYSFCEWESERAKHMAEQLRKLAVCEKDPINTAKLHMLVIQLLLWMYDARNLNERKEIITTEDPLIFNICCYIKNNLDRDLSYKTLQKHFFVSRYQLTDVFTRCMGIPLTEYIICKRLNRAVLLVRDGLGIEEAAYSAGFNTYSHFYKEFVKHYKKSPRSFFDGISSEHNE